MQPLTIAMVKPMKRRESPTWNKKQHSENEKRASSVPFAASDGK